MWKQLLLVGAFALTATAANADYKWEFAEQLGIILASEHICGLSYSQLGIQRLIEQRVGDTIFRFGKAS